jgi:hypothetical protein
LAGQPAGLHGSPRWLLLIRKPYSKRINHPGLWVEPKLLAKIEYSAKSAEGKVRHPFFQKAAGAPAMRWCGSLIHLSESKKRCSLVN